MKNRILETLKNSNRTLLEVDTGVITLAILATFVGFFLPFEGWALEMSEWHGGIWTAAALVMTAFWYMHRCLDRALDFDEGNASKLILRGYLIRYMGLTVVLIAGTVTEVLNPLIVCLAYIIIMKVAAYMQPYTHKFYNHIFHEQDPVPEPVGEEVRETERL